MISRKVIRHLEFDRTVCARVFVELDVKFSCLELAKQEKIENV